MKFSLALAALSALLACSTTEAKNPKALLTCSDWVDEGLGDCPGKINPLVCTRWSGHPKYGKCTPSRCCGSSKPQPPRPQPKPKPKPQPRPDSKWEIEYEKGRRAAIKDALETCEDDKGARRKRRDAVEVNDQDGDDNVMEHEEETVNLGDGAENGEHNEETVRALPAGAGETAGGIGEDVGDGESDPNLDRRRRDNDDDAVFEKDEETVNVDGEGEEEEHDEETAQALPAGNGEVMDGESDPNQDRRRRDYGADEADLEGKDDSDDATNVFEKNEETMNLDGKGEEEEMTARALPVSEGNDGDDPNLDRRRRDYGDDEADLMEGKDDNDDDANMAEREEETVNVDGEGEKEEHDEETVQALPESDANMDRRRRDYGGDEADLMEGKDDNDDDANTAERDEETVNVDGEGEKEEHNEETVQALPEPDANMDRRRRDYGDDEADLVEGKDDNDDDANTAERDEEAVNVDGEGKEGEHDEETVQALPESDANMDRRRRDYGNDEADLAEGKDDSDDDANIFEKDEETANVDGEGKEKVQNEETVLALPGGGDDGNNDDQFMRHRRSQKDAWQQGYDDAWDTAYNRCMSS